MAPNGSGVIQEMLRRLAEEERRERVKQAEVAGATKGAETALALKAHG
jgi:hypothetical protein